MVSRPRGQLVGVHVPVADAVERIGDQARVGYRAGKLECGDGVLARPVVVAPGPEQAEVEQGAPLGLAVVGGAGGIARRGEVGARGLEIADEVVRLAAEAQELGIDRRAKLTGGLGGARELFEGGVRRVHPQGSLASAARVTEGRLGQAGLGVVVGEIGDGIVQTRPTKLLERLGDATVEAAALAASNPA